MAVTDRLATLAHPKRLVVLRLLVRRCLDAVPAGEIGSGLDLKPSTASAYLPALRQTGLIEQMRSGTSLRHRISLPTLRRLFGGRQSECYQNQPDLCLSGRASGDYLMPLPAPPFNLLFICSENPIRSIMAEAILRSEGRATVRAHSADTTRATALHPAVIDLLQSNGCDVSGLHPKHMDEFRTNGAPKMDFVFTVCDQAANEECRAWPGQPMNVHWGLPDPVKVQRSEARTDVTFQETFERMRDRIRTFVNLAFDTLDRISLQHRLDDNGRKPGSDTKNCNLPRVP